MTSRYREKQRDAYLRIGQPHGLLGLPDRGRGRGMGNLRICQAQGSLCLPDIERSRGLCIFA